MLSCNYNGWADAPEEEREGLQAYEAAADRPPTPPTVRSRKGNRPSRPWPDSE